MSDGRTLGEAVEDAAAFAGAARGYRFIREDGRSEPFFSYAGCEHASARYGGALQALGLRRGDRVALIVPESDDFVFLFLGAIRAGLIPVPIYPPLGLGQFGPYLTNTRYIVAKSGARALVTSARIKPMLGTVKASCPALRAVITIESLRDARERVKPVKASPDDIAMLQFTSGSTARPKGVMLTHGNLAANIDAINTQGLRLGADDVGVSWLPLYHDMGLIGFVLAPLYARISTVLLPPLAFLKRPSLWLRSISRHGGTVSYGPNFAYALCVKRIRDRDLEGIDLSSWRVAGCGAEPIRAATLRTFAETFAPAGFRADAFVPSYGMAEATLAVTFEQLGRGVRADAVHGPTLWRDGVASPVASAHEEAVELVRCGRPFAHHELGVFADDDVQSERPLPERTVGELRVRGPSVMRGYFDDPGRTAEATAGGWLRTGDLGYLADGDVVLCGRSKEIILVNGRNFYPYDLEWLAGQVEGVRKGSVVAFGATDPRNDRERVVVVVETLLDGPRERSAIGARVRRSIQEGMGLSVDDVVTVGAGVLPKTSSGKLQRLLTKALYERRELEARGAARGTDRIDVAKELLRSQLSYVAARFIGS